jgi:hypothetical protein
MQEFRNCQLSLGSKASRLLYGHPVLTEPQSRAHATTDPEYRPQTTCELAVPTAAATSGPGNCLKTPQDSIGSTNPEWLETSSGSPVLAAKN